MNLQNNEKEAFEESDRLPDSPLDNPIEKKINETFITTWLARYSYRLHPSQEGTHQILRGMRRSLMNRQITSDNVKALRTLHFTKGIEPKTHILKFGESQ